MGNEQVAILSACVQAFLGIVSRNVDLMEGAVSQAEKDLEPSKIRKVFSSLPSFGVSLLCIHVWTLSPTTVWYPSIRCTHEANDR